MLTVFWSIGCPPDSLMTSYDYHFTHCPHFEGWQKQREEEKRKEEEERGSKTIWETETGHIESHYNPQDTPKGLSVNLFQWQRYRGNVFQHPVVKLKEPNSHIFACVIVCVCVWEKGRWSLCVTMHASSCVSPSAVQPPGSEEKNADYKIQGGEAGKTGNRKPVAAPCRWFPINTYSTNWIYKQGAAYI